ncbi:MAG: CvpA family protein [Synergistaceae bacterium]|jgi:uncharacterized membrane protein required for colicin V production|nr:CvpA family protein [Synergistaceae bacterium]
MNVTDLVLLIVGSYFVIRGIFRGISGEMLSLASAAGGFFCALKYYKTVSGVLISNFGVTPLLAAVFSMLGIFGLIFLICNIIDGALKKILTNTNLTWIDKLCGALAGFIKIYIIAMMALVSGMIMAPITGDAWVRESRTLVTTAKTWPLVYPFLDKAGLVPDLASIQRQAYEYILQQAATSISGISSDIALPAMTTSSDVLASGDLINIPGGIAPFSVPGGEKPENIPVDELTRSILELGRNKN